MPQFYDAFISYGRADSKTYTTHLYQGLTDRGYQVWFDQNDIPLGVDYQNEIDDGLERSHNFIFILSPHSVNSPYCRLEIELALKRNKRIIPLLHVEEISHATWKQRHPQGSDEDWDAYQKEGKHSSFPNMHPTLGKINWVYAREGLEPLDQALQQLQDIFQRQKEYVQQHTVFLSEALAWESHQKQSSYLLAPEACAPAREWLQIHFQNEQPPCLPTDLHCEFITESLEAAVGGLTDIFFSDVPEDAEVLEQVMEIDKHHSLSLKLSM